MRPVKLIQRNLKKLAHQADQAILAGDTPSAFKLFQKAQKLYEGNFLAEDLDEEWTQTYRAQWQERVHQTLCRSAECANNLALYEKAIEICNEINDLEPSHETGYALKMKAHFFNGQSQEALACYEQCEAALKLELGLTPSPEIHNLYIEILNGTLDKPRPHTQNNLPEKLTGFVGRTEELRDLCSALDQPDCRLLTVLGPGGIGKSRIGLQVGVERLAVHTDGVFWVELASLIDGSQLIDSVGASIGCKFSGRADPLEELITHIVDKNLLIILDNFEHITEQAQVVHEMLEKSPKLKLLVTSREPLELLGEQFYELDGLSVPARSFTIKEGQSSDAVKLFVKSATRYEPQFQIDTENFQPVAQICRLVDGSPLAIELATSWVRTIPLDRIASEIEENLNFLSTRMRNVPERHRSMRAAFLSTWDRLSERERQIFSKISVFRGGFTNDAAQQIADASPGELLGLINRSLVHSEADGRFQIHEMLRQFGYEALQETGEAEATQSRHLHHFTQLALQHEDGYHGPRLQQALAELQIEHRNLQAAVDYAFQRELHDEGAQLVSALGNYYSLLSYFREGRRQLGHALEHSQDIDDAIRAKLYHWSGHLARLQADYKVSEEHLLKSSELRAALGNDLDEAKSICSLGITMREMGQYEQAIGYLEKSLATFQTQENLVWQSFALNGLASIAKFQGDYPRAIELVEQGLAVSHSIDDENGIAIGTASLALLLMRTNELERAQELVETSLKIDSGLNNRARHFSNSITYAVILQMQGQYDKAREIYYELLNLHSEFGHETSFSLMLSNFAKLEELCGKPNQAIERYQQSLEISRRANNRKQEAYALMKLGKCFFLNGSLSEAEDHLAGALIIQHELHDEFIYTTLVTIGGLIAQSNPAESVQIFQFLAQKRSKREAFVSEDEREFETTYSTLATEALEPNEYQCAIEQGISMSLDQVVQLASRLSCREVPQ